jgi:hypothetical protein
MTWPRVTGSPLGQTAPVENERLSFDTANALSALRNAANSRLLRAIEAALMRDPMLEPGVSEAT